MMVMVSLNLADVMTALRPSTSQPLPDDPDQPASPVDEYLRREREGYTLQPTALVNEAYLRLVDQKMQSGENRALGPK